MIINIVRKPLIGSVCENITLYNTGGLNIDQTRIQFETDGKRKETKRTPREENGVWTDSNSGMKKEKSLYADADPKGRFPANVVISEKSTQHFPQSLGWSSQNHNTFNMYGGNSLLSSSTQRTGFHKGYDDSGSASRYFKVVEEDE